MELRQPGSGLFAGLLFFAVSYCSHAQNIVHSILDSSGRIQETYSYIVDYTSISGSDIITGDITELGIRKNFSLSRTVFSYNENGDILQEIMYEQFNYLFMELSAGVKTPSEIKEYRYSGTQLTAINEATTYTSGHNRNTTFFYKDGLLVKTSTSSPEFPFPHLHFYTYDAQKRLLKKTEMSIYDTTQVRSYSTYVYQPETIILSDFSGNTLGLTGISILDLKGNILEHRRFTKTEPSPESVHRYIYNKKGQLIRSTYKEQEWKKAVTTQKVRYRKGIKLQETNYRVHIREKKPALVFKEKTRYLYTRI